MNMGQIQDFETRLGRRATQQELRDEETRSFNIYKNIGDYKTN